MAVSRMMRELACAMLAIGLFVTSGWSQEKPSIEPYSVSVRRKLSEDDAKIYFEERVGVRIQAILVNPGKTMLSVDEKASTLEYVKDDLGNDLMKAAPKSFPSSSWVDSFSFKASERGDRALSTFVANSPPAKGAKTISIKGKLAILCGTSEKTVDEKEVALKADSKNKMKIGDLTLTIEKSFGSELSFKFESAGPNLRNVIFTTTDGKSIPVNKPSNTRFGFNNKYTYGTTYSVKPTTEKLNLSVTYFDKVEVIDFPVELTVGLGL